MALNPLRLLVAKDPCLGNAFFFELSFWVVIFFWPFDGVGTEDSPVHPHGLFAEHWAQRHCITAGPSPCSPWASGGGVRRCRSSRGNSAQHSCRVSACFHFICLTEGHLNLGEYCQEASSHNSTSPDSRAASRGLQKLEDARRDGCSSRGLQPHLLSTQTLLPRQ